MLTLTWTIVLFVVAALLIRACCLEFKRNPASEYGWFPTLGFVAFIASATVVNLQWDFLGLPLAVWLDSALPEHGTSVQVVTAGLIVWVWAATCWAAPLAMGWFLAQMSTRGSASAEESGPTAEAIQRRAP